MTRLSPAFLVTAFALAFSVPALSQNTPPELQQKAPPQTGGGADDSPIPQQKQERQIFEGTMTLEKMAKILLRIDDNTVRRKNGWQLTVEDVPVVLVTDEAQDRMRILVAIQKTDTLSADELQRLLQANFDTALDARYAIAHGIVWATYIHPLRELHDRQFIAAIGQTVNLAKTYGSSFSSGALIFGGGDSRDILRRKLIEDLLKKGQPI